MREDLEKSIRHDAWVKYDPRYRRLDILDLWLDGKIYDHLLYSYSEETDGAGNYIKRKHRKPSVRWKMPRMVANYVARKLFAGRHAPSIHHPDEKVRLAVQALIQEAKLEQKMLQAAKRGSVGSVAITFKVVDEQTPTLVAEVFAPKYCTPVFDVTGALRSLRVQYLVSASWFSQQGVAVDHESKSLDPKKSYWFVRDFTKTHEITYFPIQQAKWNPTQYISDKLVEIQDGDFQKVNHNLGFVPAHWIINLTDGEYPDGACTFESGLDNNLLYDYGMSHLDLGASYSATPQLCIKGNLTQDNEKNGGVVVRGPSRYIQLEGDTKSEQFEESGSDAFLIEPTGKGMEVYNEFLKQVKKDCLEQITASRKDPDKVTTAMSGKALEVIEEEFIDLMMELRTNYGDEGYLKILKAAAKSAIKANHPLLSGISVEDIDAIYLGWPPVHELNPSEFAHLIAGLSQGVENQIITKDETRDLFNSQVDIAVTSANRREDGTVVDQETPDQQEEEDQT